MSSWFGAVARQRVRPRIESLEDRCTPSTLVGLTSGNALVRFDSGSPGTIQSTVQVSGLAVGESLVGIDYRPATGQLFALSSASRVYVIDPANGQATAVGGTLNPPLSGSAFGTDFNPITDQLREVSDTGQDMRIAPTGTVAATDPNLFYDPNNYNDFFGTAPQAPHVVAAAYTKNLDATGKTTVTTQYGIDSTRDQLVTQGGPEGDPSPDTGRLFIVGNLNFDATDATGFDIEPGTDKAYAVSGSKLYSIDLTTGAGTAIGTVGTGADLRGVAVAPPAAGPGTIQLAANTFTFSADRKPLAVTVTRTGGSTGTVTINYATSDGTAVAGVDYAPASGTLTFMPGETTQTIFLLLPAGQVPPAPAKTFNLTLSSPTGGATLGGTAAATINIPAVTAVTPVHLFAVGAGAGSAPQVTVYNGVGGAQVATFLAFESTFTGGVQVATGDVNGDGVDDVILGTGIGGAPRVRVVDGAGLMSGAVNTISDTFPYESTFRGGVQVATGDVNGDGFMDVIAGAGVGGGPRIHIIDGASLISSSSTSDTGGTTLADFFAYEPSFRGGVTVAAGNFNNDGFADVIAGSGDGGAPRVRILDGKTLTNDTQTPLTDYFAYDPSFRNGVYVAAGDIDGDGTTDLIAGAGVGGGPNVRAFSGTTSNAVAGFFAFDPSSRGGVRVVTEDLLASGKANILAASGPGGTEQVRAFDASGMQVMTFDPLPASFTGGVFVG
jgi:hypothetical protein